MVNAPVRPGSALSTSSDLKELADKFCTKPPFAFHCKLSGVCQPAMDWINEMKMKFTSLTMMEDEVPFKCQFIGHDVSTGRHSVTLFAFSETNKGREVADEGREVAAEAEDITDGGATASEANEQTLEADETAADTNVTNSLTDRVCCNCLSVCLVQFRQMM